MLAALATIASSVQAQRANRTVYLDRAGVIRWVDDGQEVTLFGAEPRRLRPVLTFDVVDDSRFRPCQQRGNDEANAFAGPRWGKCENVLRTVVTQIVQPPGFPSAPSSDVHALLRAHQTSATKSFSVAQRAEP